MKTPVILLCFSQQHLESNTIQEICSRVGGHEKGKVLLNTCAIFKHQTKAYTWSECLFLCCGNADPGTEQGCGKLFTTCPKQWHYCKTVKVGSAVPLSSIEIVTGTKHGTKGNFNSVLRKKISKKKISFQHKKFTCFEVGVPPTKEV